MKFVNIIAEIVHGATVRHFGLPNKNVGDAFLLVWKFQTDEEGVPTESASPPELPDEVVTDKREGECEEKPEPKRQRSTVTAPHSPEVELELFNQMRRLEGMQPLEGLPYPFSEQETAASSNVQRRVASIEAGAPTRTRSRSRSPAREETTGKTPQGSITEFLALHPVLGMQRRITMPPKVVIRSSESCSPMLRNMGLPSDSVMTIVPTASLNCA